MHYKSRGRPKAGGAPERLPYTVEDIDTALAQLSLSEFIRQAWSVMEPLTPYVPNWHIDAICEHLEAQTAGQIRNLLILVPPRHTKSLVVSVAWPAWEWIRNAGIRWLYSSYDAGLSVRDSVKCRRLVQSQWYQRRWGNRFKITGDQNAKERWENDKGGYRLATSVGGAATGEGGERICVDDPINIKLAGSDTVRNGVLSWWDEVMSTRANDPETSTRTVIMQRCHDQDLAGHLIEQGGYEVLRMPAEYEARFPCQTSIGFQDPRTEEGELLCPARFPRVEVDALKRQLGSFASAAQLQQRPTPLEGGIIKRNWLRFWRQLPETFDEMIQSWDMSFKDLQESSYVVGQVWLRRGADKYLVDQTRERMRFVATLNAVRMLTTRYPNAAAKLVEDKANGTAVMDVLRSEIGGLIPIEPEGSKTARLEAVSPDFESNNVYLPDPGLYPWVLDYITELCAFPFAANNDQVDATSQALSRFHKTQKRLNLPPLVSETKVSAFASMGNRPGSSPSVWGSMLTTR